LQGAVHFHPTSVDEVVGSEVEEAEPMAEEEELVAMEATEVEVAEDSTVEVVDVATKAEGSEEAAVATCNSIM